MTGAADDGPTPNASAVPQTLRRQLESELATARRLAATDPEIARARVHDAEVALSGVASGEAASGEAAVGEAAVGEAAVGEAALGEAALGGVAADREARLAATMRALLRHRRPEATICPSDAARVVGGDGWRGLMDTAREVAAELAREGTLTVRQRGAVVDIATAVGPVRLARGPRW
ncbi:DUF3253 domain-containing protein [Symbioplanes lichenis]|uniref:DUF3253 domain-containing protein n=1 Tax=Symbioplanes lichenis TaxID=1629072 RepID=UPI002739C445|nr:DUF3253 domain-containing protein [Actinoplanes lichenis]